MNQKMLSTGVRLKECRTNKKLTQRQLAELLYNSGYGSGTAGSEKQIGFLENNNRDISSKYATSLGRVLGIRPEYLLLYDNYKTDEDLNQAKRNAYCGIDALIEYIASQHRALLCSNSCYGNNRDVFISGKAVGMLTWIQYEKLQEDIYDFAEAWINRILNECEGT